jgi:flagellar hook-associated protein 3 FlgL
LATGTPQPATTSPVAVEIDAIRASVLGSANTTYLGRPVFGGTTDAAVAYDASGGYTGDPADTGAETDPGRVERTISNGTKVRVDVSGPGTFGVGSQQLMTVLSTIADDLRNNPAALGGDLDQLDVASAAVQSGLTSIGSRSNQLDQMRQSATDSILDMRVQLSDVEDIDLPKTITELSLQQTAYQAALSATAKVIQPSLVDFLR